MARKPKPATGSIMDGIKPVALDKEGWPKKCPFLMEDSTAYIAKPIVVIERSVKAWRGVAWAFEQSAVVDRVMHDRDCSPVPDVQCRFHYLSPAEQGHANDVSATHYQWMRNAALEQGATPEAIRLLASVEAFTKKEVDTMAEKLAKKSATKAEKEVKTKAPKAEKAPSGRKGNPEALKKAQEAAAGKRAEFGKQKLTLLVKPADSGLRGGRLAKLEFVTKAKPKTAADVLGQEFEHDGKTITIDAGSLRGMAEREHIKLG